MIKLLEGVVNEDEFLKEGLRKKKLMSGFYTFKNHVYGYFVKELEKKKYEVVGRWENIDTQEELKYV